MRDPRRVNVLLTRLAPAKRNLAGEPLHLHGFNKGLFVYKGYHHRGYHRLALSATIRVSGLQISDTTKSYSYYVYW